VTGGLGLATVPHSFISKEALCALPQ